MLELTCCGNYRHPVSEVETTFATAMPLQIYVSERSMLVCAHVTFFFSQGLDCQVQEGLGNICHPKKMQVPIHGVDVVPVMEVGTQGRLANCKSERLNGCTIH